MTDDLTIGQITRLLKERFDADAECVGLERGQVGNGQETWFVDVTTPDGSRPLVIRRSAPGGPLRWTKRADEHAMLAAAFAAGLPVPEVHWMEEEPSALGRSYFVMDRMPGSAGSGPTHDQTEVAVELGRLLAE
ncbi:MAG: phosphotransferase, partial [Acidimicrobiia bacterium]|nr:phosphotransferase [Acidimicrobiia bacterium]